NNLKRAQVIVRAFCEERSIPYRESGALESNIEILQFLYQVSAPAREARAGFHQGGEVRGKRHEGGRGVANPLGSLRLRSGQAYESLPDGPYGRMSGTGRWARARRRGASRASLPPAGLRQREREGRSATLVR